MKKQISLFSLLLSGLLACHQPVKHQAQNHPPDAASLPCRMSPFLPEILLLPPQGFVSVDNKNTPCSLDATPAWEHHANKSRELFVHASGPDGSGRYWSIALAVAPKGTAEPQNGICFTTTTLGWRTLQGFEDRALPWIEDVDGDGESEFIVWTSFAPADGEDRSLPGLMAWVYRPDKTDRLVLDWTLSRTFAARIATAYRLPLRRKEFLEERNIIASQLEAFATEACKVN